jgi:methionyl-tRNA synthetase
VVLRHAPLVATRAPSRDHDAAAQAKARTAGDAIAGARPATSLYALVEALRLAAIFCQPFIPSAASRIAAQLGLADDWREGSRAWGGYAPGTRVRPGPALFPKR